MLDTILNNASMSLKNKVEKAYAPLLKNNSAFNQALLFAIEWTNNDFEKMGAILKKMKPHSALYIGCTNSSYQLLNRDEEKALNQQWGNWLVDSTFLPMNHFDLIDKIHAKIINQFIFDWLAK